MPGNASGIRAGKAFVEIGGNDTELQKALDRASKRLKGFGMTISKIGAATAGLGTAIAAPMLVAAHAFAEFGDTIAKASTRTGITAENLSTLKYAAEQSGASFETLEGGVRKMSKFLVSAAEGASEATDVLDEMGLTIDQFVGKKPDEQMKLFADGIERVKDPTIRAALAMQIFGKTGTELIPLMADGAKGIEALQAQARSLGLQMSTQDAKAAEEFHDRMDDLHNVLKMAVVTIGAAVAPAIREVVTVITAVAVRVKTWIDENRDLVATVFKVSAGLVALGTVVTGVGIAILALSKAYAILGTVFAPVVASASLITPLIAAMLSPIGLVTAAVVGLGAYLLYTTGAGKVAVDYLSRAFFTLKDDAEAAFGGIADAIKGNDWGLAAQIAWTTLRMEFYRGANELGGFWNTFVPSTLKYFSEMWAGMLTIAEIGRNALNDSLSSVVKFYADGFTNMAFVAKRAWIEIREAAFGIAKAIFESQDNAVGHDAIARKQRVSEGERLYREKLASDQAQKDPKNQQVRRFSPQEQARIDEYLQAKKGEAAHAKAIEDEKDAVLKEANDEIRQRQREFNRESEDEQKRHTDRMVEIDQELKKRQAAIANGTTFDVLGAQLEISKLKAEQAALVAAAGAAAARGNGAPALPKLPNAGDIADGLGDLGKRSSAGVGTFSAVAASLLGRKDDKGAQIAKNTADTVKAAKDIATAVRAISFS